MRAGNHPGSERSLAAEPFRGLLYRYFFFDWLFRDASRGSLLERASALRFNRQRSHYLPVYLRRWIGVVVCSCAVGASFEKALSMDYAASAFYCLTCISIVVATMIVRLWLGLKYE
jgi:hypothetical protein